MKTPTLIKNICAQVLVYCKLNLLLAGLKRYFSASRIFTNIRGAIPAYWQRDCDIYTWKNSDKGDKAHCVCVCVHLDMNMQVDMFIIDRHVHKCK